MALDKFEQAVLDCLRRLDLLPCKPANIFYESMIAYAFSVGYRFGFDDANIKDLYNQSFLNLSTWARQNSIDEKLISLTAYFKKVIRNTALKSAQKRPDNIDIDLMAQNLGLNPSVLAKITLEEVLRNARLHPFWNCLELDLQGYTQDEIAAQIGTDRSTVSRRLQNIKNHLKKYFSGDEQL